jgi:hypothetical protein
MSEVGVPDFQTLSVHEAFDPQLALADLHVLNAGSLE